MPKTLTISTFISTSDGKQAKGETITENLHYDNANGRKVTNTSINIDGQAYNADAQGRLTAKFSLKRTNTTSLSKIITTTGITGKDDNPSLVIRPLIHFNLYFHEDGRQAKNEIVTINGDSYYLDKDNVDRSLLRRWC